MPAFIEYEGPEADPNDGIIRMVPSHVKSDFQRMFGASPQSIGDRESRHIGEGVEVFLLKPRGGTVPLGHAATVGDACTLVESMGYRSEGLWSTWGYQHTQVKPGHNCARSGELAQALLPLHEVL